jgi:hypothetical protein
VRLDASTYGSAVCRLAAGGFNRVIFALFIALVPIASGIAILRHRLYDIDRLINRTLVYGLLTALLGGVYASAVSSLGRVFMASGSSEANAAKTVEVFSARLRDEIDLDTLTAELLAVVDQTMQPTQASLWIRPSTR